MIFGLAPAATYRQPDLVTALAARTHPVALCRLCALPAGCAVNLTVLDIGQNRITALPAALAELTQLRTLFATENRLGHDPSCASLSVLGYGKLFIILDHFARTSQLCTTLHTPWYMFYVVPMLIGG